MTDFHSQIDYFSLELNTAGIITSGRTIDSRKWKKYPDLRKALELAESKIFFTIPEKLWAIINRTDRPICTECENVTAFINVKCGYRLTCSQKCNANSHAVRTRIKQTEQERYNGKHHTQDNIWIKNFVKDCREKGSYAKGQITFKEKYGVENRYQLNSVKKKIIETNITRLGVSNPMQSLDVKEKFIKTCLERYGEIHPMHVPEIYEKSQRARFSWKKVQLPSGDIRMLQGYEPYVIHYLLELGLLESDIITDKKNGMPTIKYKWENKTKCYYPDMYIPSQNTLLEVKSEYIWKKEETRNLAKQQASKDAGYNHYIVVWDKKKGLLEVI